MVVLPTPHQCPLELTKKKPEVDGEGGGERERGRGGTELSLTVANLDV